MYHQSRQSNNSTAHTEAHSAIPYIYILLIEIVIRGLISIWRKCMCVSFLLHFISLMNSQISFVTFFMCGNFPTVITKHRNFQQLSWKLTSSQSKIWLWIATKSHHWSRNSSEEMINKMKHTHTHTHEIKPNDRKNATQFDGIDQMSCSLFPINSEMDEWMNGWMFVATLASLACKRLYNYQLLTIFPIFSHFHLFGLYFNYKTK